jgi:hypothetical protein
MHRAILSGGLCLSLLLTGCGETPQRDPNEGARTPTTAPAAPTPVSTALPTPSAAPAPTPAAVVYRWTPPASAPDGRVGATGGGWNTLISVPTGVLQGGHEYHAELAYTVVVSPPYPGNPFFGSFHMFARSKTLGQARDVWLNWLGDPGEQGIARLPLVLAPADDWTFTVGCKGAGELIVSNLEIREGSGFTYIPAATDAVVPASPATVATGCASIVLDPPAAGTGLEVSTQEFGMIADGADGPATPEVAAANALALSRALRACGTRNASRLVIPPGTYRLAPKDPLMVDDLYDLIVDGQGAELIYTKLLRNTSAWNMRNCARMEIRNLIIDWDWTLNPIASLSRVESVAEDRCSCVLAFPELDPAVVERLKTAEWSHFTPIDPVTLQGLDTVRLAPQVTARESAEAGTLKVSFSTPQPLTAGMHLMIRHLYYEMGAFKLNDCNNLLFDHVTVYSMPGMGWICRGDLHHLALKHCAIQRRPGSRRVFSTSADGFHIGDSQGSILIEDSEITSTGDDCINIHDNCAQGVQKTGPNTLVLINNPKWRMKAAVGDRVELYRPDYAPIGFIGTVKTVTYTGKNKSDATLEFAEALPETVSPLSIAFNHRYGTSGVRIVNNRFDHGRLLLSVRHATIEGNDFDHPSANAIQLATEIAGALWSEGSGNEDIVIRNNVIRGANKAGKFGGPTIHAVPVLPAGRTTYPLFRNILIENNRFIDCYGPFLSLGASQDVVVRGNRIEADALVPGANVLAGCVKVECSSSLYLGGNTWKTGVGQKKPGILIDTATTHDAQTAGNRLE